MCVYADMSSTFFIVVQLLITTVTAQVAPGDEQLACTQFLWADGAAPIPAYSNTMVVLMDSWNYENLLSSLDGVWNQTSTSDSDSAVSLNSCTIHTCSCTAQLAHYLLYGLYIARFHFSACIYAAVVAAFKQFAMSTICLQTLLYVCWAGAVKQCTGHTAYQ